MTIHLFIPLFGPITVPNYGSWNQDSHTLLTVIHNDHTRWNALSINVDVARYMYNSTLVLHPPWHKRGRPGGYNCFGVVRHLAHRLL
jgi:hypothetical protein